MIVASVCHKILLKASNANTALAFNEILWLWQALAASETYQNTFGRGVIISHCILVSIIYQTPRCAWSR